MRQGRILGVTVLLMLLVSLLGISCAGAQGEQGPKGDTGANGVGIAEMISNADGTITVVLTNNTSYTTGNLRGPQGEQGIQGIQGVKGDTGTQGIQGIQGTKGDPGGLAWNSGLMSGPIVYNMGTGGWFKSIGPLSPGDRVEFTFSVSGSQVYYWANDTYYNNILVGYGGYAVSSGAGAFIAAMSGTHYIVFISKGDSGSSVATLYYTIYPHL